ncbi:hypothetical protein [Ramlibacter sp.]|uniref:hypothetical protein n=1 Tax=Ramlibacter sp. TaxID=1917967 RepID=UPI002BC07725|nr:hypothetical protein [Ramlibacter sp.]HWI84386.1 hypothetical protein [Ramlibacter sp.]
MRALGDSPAWMLIGLAGLASAGWLLERRRRRELETEKDSVLWAGVQPPGSSIITDAGDEQTPQMPRPPRPATEAPAVTTTISSRREATLIDLQQLDSRLRRRRARGDLLAAVVLLQQHVADFRFTSPWVFLELRELHQALGRAQEWELARAAFQARFGQRAPLWQAPSTAEALLADDPDICADLAAQWPYRGARLVILHWLLGERGTPEQPQHPPVLALGVYRELLYLDRLLDLVMLPSPAVVDSLL